jgi:hypothetical protein
VQLTKSFRSEDVDLIYRKSSAHQLETPPDLELFLITLDRSQAFTHSSSRPFFLGDSFKKGLYLFRKTVKGDFIGGIFFTYNIQHCFICRLSDSTVPTDAGVEPRTDAAGALAVGRSKIASNKKK